MSTTAKIKVTLKKGVLDPQGEAVRKSLASMGFSGIEEVRIGRFIEVVVDTDDKAEAKAQAEKMCTALLANMVIETSQVEI